MIASNIINQVQEFRNNPKHIHPGSLLAQCTGSLAECCYCPTKMVNYRTRLEMHRRAVKFIYFISYLSYKLRCCMLSDKRCLSHGMCLYQIMMTLHFLNDVANDDESTQKSKITS